MRVAVVALVALALAPSAQTAEPVQVELKAVRGDLRGAVFPAAGGVIVELLRGDVVVASTRTRASGSFSLGRALPGFYRARAGEAVSAEVRVLGQPRLEARLVGSRLLGKPLRLIARVRPAAAGRLAVRVVRGGRVTYDELHGATARVGLSTRRPQAIRVVVTLQPAEGWAGARRTLEAVVVPPLLAYGSRGPAVRELHRRLRELGYAVPGIDGAFDLETQQAVIAFQKVQGLSWTGRVDARIWTALWRARRPMPRFPGTHLEVIKSRQVLFVVQGSRVVSVVHVSTGATGNTPVGTWRIYRKVAGWDWVLWYPMYFLRGFAIHGYPSVPFYPASHGCVRVPMWVAPSLYGRFSHGRTVYVLP